MRYRNIRHEIAPLQDDDIIDIANGAIWRPEAETNTNEQLSQNPISPLEPAEANTATDAARILGRLSKGKPKRYSPEEIAIRTERLKHAREAKRKP